MINTFSLEQIAKCSDLIADFLMRNYKLDKMAKFIEIKPINPKLEQSEIARELKISSFTLQRYKGKTNMLSPYRMQPSAIVHT